MKADVRDNTGATARTLAMKYGHTKIVGLIDLHAAPVPKVFCRGPGNRGVLACSFYRIRREVLDILKVCYYVHGVVLAGLSWKFQHF